MVFRCEEFHYWKPTPIITEWLTKKVIPFHSVVVDVGAGHCPFPRADIAVDRLPETHLQAVWDDLKVKERPDKIIQCDFSREPLPFKDKEIDFVYCRHTLEDMYDPFILLGEITRVGKAGYIETPSPIAELTRGADGFENSQIYRGYYHHRHFVWSHGGHLNFVGKFPAIEHFDYEEDKLEDALRRGPELWNSYFLWTNEICFRHYEEPIDFDFSREYRALLWRAALECTQSTESFCQMVNQEMNQAA